MPLLNEKNKKMFSYFHLLKDFSSLIESVLQSKRFSIEDQDLKKLESVRRNEC